MQAFTVFSCIRSTLPSGDQDDMAARIDKSRLSVHHALKTHNSICLLPLPVLTTQLIAVRLNNSPDSGKYSYGLPPLERAMNRAVNTQILRKPVPLAAGKHSEDDRVEHLARVFSHASSRLRRVNLCDQWLNLLPKVVRYFPDCIKRILFGRIGFHLN